MTEIKSLEQFRETSALLALGLNQAQADHIRDHAAFHGIKSLSDAITFYKLIDAMLRFNGEIVARPPENGGR